MKKFILMMAIMIGTAHFVNSATSKPLKQTSVELEPGGDDGGIPLPPKPKFP